MSEFPTDTCSVTPETPQMYAGINIIRVTDLDKREVLLPIVMDLNQRAHPARTIRHQGQFLISREQFPIPPLVGEDQLPEGKQTRLIEFLNWSNLPIVIATYLALNTEEPIEDWILPQPLPCIAIVGMAEVGKTTYTEALAKATNSPILDMELFDKTQPDRPKSVRESLESVCQIIKQRLSLYKKDPESNPLPTMVLTDTNGEGWWDNREINPIDFFSQGSAEFRIHILTVKNIKTPLLIRATEMSGIKALGPIGVSGLVYFQTTDRSKNPPEEFVRQVLAFTDDRGYSITRLGQLSRIGFIFGSPWWDGESPHTN